MNQRYVSNLMLNTVREACRNSSYTLQGFPNVADLIAQINNNNKNNFSIHAKYEICLPFPDGTLVIPTAIAKEWGQHEQFKDKLEALIQLHNDTYNPDNKSDSDNIDPTKVEDSEMEMIIGTDVKTAEQFAVKHPDGDRLSIFGGELMTSGPDGDMWLAAGDKESMATVNEICFSFGTGTFEEGSDATNLMSDATQPWLSFKLNGPSHPIMFEVEKASTTPKFVSDFAQKMKDKVMSLGALLNEFEQNGEVRATLPDLSHPFNS